MREAIGAANAQPGSDITVPSGTYILSLPGTNEDYNATGDLDIYSDMTISGAGANITTIDGNGIDRVLSVWSSATVDISGLTVTGGNAPALSGQYIGAGGGISAQGTLLTLTNVTVRNNTTQVTTDPSRGGGIFVGGPVTLNNCTVSNNSASYGGGIDNYVNGPLTLNNSTVSGNTAGLGGGIVASNHGNTLILNNCTVSGNSSSNGGGFHQVAGTVFMKNTILANNGGGNCAFPGSYTSALISLGHNLSTDVWCDPDHVVSANVTGGLNQSSDINEMPAGLAPLDNYGGPTKTHALLPGSLAIDNGNPDLPGSGGNACETTDQRGVPRPEGAACDIGAYEACEALDGDGIEDSIDTQPCVFSNAFSDGTTSGTVTGTGGWLVQVQDLPQPAGVQASISGAGTLATFLSCATSGPERVSLDAFGETASITCSATGSMTVTAQVATPKIQLRKPPTGGPATVVNLGQGQTATIGSPIIADPNNVSSFLVQIVDENDNQLGSFLLDPGQVADVTFPTETTVTVTNLGPGDLTVVVGTQVATLTPGQSQSFPLGGPDVPTVSEWGLVVLTLIGLTAGTIVFRRPQVTCV